MPKNPWTLRAGPDADWAAELKITYVRPSLRARALGTVYRGQEDSVRFRGQFGQPNTLDRAVPVGPGGPLPWDAALVEVVATLFFIRQGAGGSRRGEPAYPDVLELNAAEPPAELRGTVVANKYGQAWS